MFSLYFPRMALESQIYDLNQRGNFVVEMNFDENQRKYSDKGLIS